MKLLNTVIVLGLMQLVAIKPLEASTVFQEKILQFYTKEMQAIDTNFCEKAQILCLEIKEWFDGVQQQTAKPVWREFKQNITDFLHEYPTYMKYKYTNQLVWLFNAITPPQPSNNKELQKIWQLLKNHGYDQLVTDYQSNFLKFVKQKFLPKFEELKQHFNTSELKQHQALLQWYNEWKNCQDYDCYSKNFDSSQFAIENLTPKTSLLQYIQAQLNSMKIFYGINAHDITTDVLHSQKFLQLTPALRENLKESINHFLYEFENHKNIDQLQNASEIFYNNVLWKYYYNNTIQLKDLKLLRDIFDEQGYAKFATNYERKLRNFVQTDLSDKFQQFKAALSQKELVNEEPFLKWFDHLKSSTTAMDIVGAFGRSFAE